MRTRDEFNESISRLSALAVCVAVGILALSYWVFAPLIASTPAMASAKKVEVPGYDYRAWYAFPVQEGGRVKPLKTACIEAMRTITGRSEYEINSVNDDAWVKTWRRMSGQGHLNHIDCVAIVLQWILLNGTSDDPRFVDWENQAFVLCEQHDLRKKIYEHLEKEGTRLTEEQLHGKYISPADLRASPGFEQLLEEGRIIQMRDREKGMQQLSPTQKKAEEVSTRLVLFDKISQNNPVSKPRKQQHEDPFHIVALDKVPGGGWFSLGELREMRASRAKWNEVMQDRLARTPQLYIKPECQQALREFQKHLKSGDWQHDVDELAGELQTRRDKKLQQFQELRKGGDSNQAFQFLFTDIAKTPEDQQRLARLVHGKKKDQAEETERAMTVEIRKILADGDAEFLNRLKGRGQAARSAGYDPENPEYRMLHLDYLEARFPNVYAESRAWQEFPVDEADQVIGSFGELRHSYLSGDAEKFERATQAFFQTVQRVSEEVDAYPGEDTPGERLLGMARGRPLANPDSSLLNLELRFNRAKPFMWAWVIMLAGVLFFIGSLALNSRVSYLIGFILFFASLGLQLFGLYCRMAISGRPPVSNMYETLVWVPLMASMFALILELVYRRGVIILAGAVVAILGLISADTLPMELGERISGLQPVLRSNYWLTVHVLTIVSSYAGGALAWGLGNISLALLAFSQPRRDLLKTLAQFSYRAMQIAVLLLAAGTFLGGWWAAESWGRFWGWDPKEVWALIALVCYVIPLHMRFLGWVKDFGLAVSAVLCFAAIVMSWYGVNFVLAAGLHSYGFGSGSPWLIFWCGLLNIEWVLIASILYMRKTRPPLAGAQKMPTEEEMLVEA